jgi:5'-3' exonuclease
MNKEKVIIVDSGNLMHRSIFAYRTNPQVPCTYTYCRMVISNLKNVETNIDDLVILACDYGRSWRKGLDKNYKAQRKDFRESKESSEWWKQRYAEFDLLFEKLDEAMNWQRIALWGWEADDIASVAARYYKDKEVILISSDKDWEMLATFDNVKIFSPISKKFKVIPAPMKVLMEKINGDISDNLLTKPSSEAEFEIRKRIVDLTQLPQEIEQPIREELDKIMPKNLYLHKIPFKSIKEEIKKLYKLNE